MEERRRGEPLSSQPCSSAARACLAAAQKGSARQLDHAELVHQQWLEAALLGLQLWIVRVASEDNIADEPPRLKVDALLGLGATLVEPVLRTSLRTSDVA